MSCRYHTVSDFASINDDTNLSFIGMNIDGFKSNFDSFLIIHEKIFADGYFICECNVTEEESNGFYIPNYNKFVLDRLSKSNGKI